MLTRKYLLEEGMELKPTEKLLVDKESDFFQQHIQSKIKSEGLPELKYNKNWTSDVEPYTYMKNDEPVEIMIQKIRDADKDNKT